MAYLELHAVSKRYAAAEPSAALEVLNGINMTLDVGESLAVVGPSGCGKSTLLNLIGALDRPCHGTIRLDDDVLEQRSEEQLAKIRNRKIGFVFQQHHLLPQYTVLENVLIPTLAVRRNVAERTADTERAIALLERVGLSERKDHRPGRLSGGEMQRTAVVRALINRPKLLLADEPTGSLDQSSARALGDLLVELNRSEHIALLLVTHSMELARRMNKVYRLENGKLAKESQL